MKSKVALWNKVADRHVKGQAMNPFSNDSKVQNLHKPSFSKEDYGKPPKGSLSELRALKASINVNREILQLCDVIDQTGERLFTEEERPNDPRKAISFGELFTVSLLRYLARVHIRLNEFKYFQHNLHIERKLLL